MRLSTVVTSLAAATVAAAAPQAKAAASVEAQNLEIQERISAIEAQGCQVGSMLSHWYMR